MESNIDINDPNILSELIVKIKVKGMKKFSFKLWFGGIFLKIAGWIMSPISIELTREGE